MRRSETARTRRLAVERLETRSLMSATSTPDLAAMGTIDQPRGATVVPLTVPRATFTTAASGKILFNVQVAADGSDASPASFTILDARGRSVGSGSTRGGVLSGRVALELGDYRVVVRSRGPGTGSIVVMANMVGDVDGDHDVDAADMPQSRTTTARVAQGEGKSERKPPTTRDSTSTATAAWACAI